VLINAHKRPLFKIKNVLDVVLIAVTALWIHQIVLPVNYKKSFMTLK
jgi:hypothetical protein